MLTPPGSAWLKEYIYKIWPLYFLYIKSYRQRLKFTDHPWAQKVCSNGHTMTLTFWPENLQVSLPVLPLITNSEFIMTHTDRWTQWNICKDYTSLDAGSFFLNMSIVSWCQCICYSKSRSLLKLEQLFCRYQGYITKSQLFLQKEKNSETKNKTVTVRTSSSTRLATPYEISSELAFCTHFFKHVKILIHSSELELFTLLIKNYTKFIYNGQVKISKC